MTQSFTREEFYDLVWSKPMTHLAKEFRLSDVALHKICKKHDIPKPPLGWWAKKQAGKPVRQTPLPPAAEDKETRISITAGELRGEPELMAVAREEARIAASSIDSEADVPSHPIIERTTAKLRKAKPAAGSILVRGNARRRDGSASRPSVQSMSKNAAMKHSTIFSMNSLRSNACAAWSAACVRNSLRQRKDGPRRSLHSRRSAWRSARQPSRRMGYSGASKRTGFSVTTTTMIFARPDTIFDAAGALVGRRPCPAESGELLMQGSHSGLEPLH